MKILLFTPYIEESTEYNFSLAKELGTLVELHVAFFKTEYPAYLRNCTVHYISSSILPGKMKREWMELLKEIEPDIVHIEDRGMYQSTLIQKCTQQLGYKVVVSPQHMLNRGAGLRLLYQKRMLARADAIVINSKAEWAMLSKWEYKEKMAVIAHGVEMDRVKLKTDWERRKKILVINRMGTEDEMEMFIDTVSLLKQELREYRIAIIDEGSPLYSALFKETVKEAGVEHLFDFYEGIDKENKWRLYRESALYVLLAGPGEADHTVREALASGTPVVATHETSWEELETNHCGWWVEASTEAMAEAIKEYLQLSEKGLDIMGRNGRKLVEEKYSCSKVAGQYLTLYSQMQGNIQPEKQQTKFSYIFN